MIKLVPMRKLPVTLLILLFLFNSKCSFRDTTADPFKDGNTIPDSLKYARKLDRESTGYGKINLASRLQTIGSILSAYKSALPETSGEEAGDVKKRMEELELEERLVKTLLNALDSLQHEGKARTDSITTDCRWIQVQLKAVYTEAEFFKPLSGSSIEPFFQRLLDPSLPPQPDIVPEPEQPKFDTDTWLAAALHLDPTEPPDWFLEHVLEAENLPAYGLTHQYFSLLLQQYFWQGTTFSAKHKVKVNRLANLIAEDVTYTAFSDLYAERVAMLIAGGHSNLVRKEWIERIVENRLSNSLWPLIAGDKSPYMHSTYIALWAIAGYQVLLQRGEQGRKELFPFKP